MKVRKNKKRREIWFREISTNSIPLFQNWSNMLRTSAKDSSWPRFIQITGFRGIIIGPVMNGIGTVQNGIIAGIHFSRHGDSYGTIVKGLYEKLGYWLTPSLRNIMDSCVMLEQGYHTSEVTRYIMKMGNSFLVTHSEKLLIGHLVLPRMPETTRR